DIPLSVYSGRAIIKIPARTTAKLATGAHTIRAKVSFQACNDQACFPPKTMEVTIPIEVVDAQTKVNAANQDIFAAKSPTGKSAPKSGHK
ncbi:MAG: protein-disulfide reductase DsbD domain-containing protein, partial [Acidobacteriota bacterium]